MRRAAVVLLIVVVGGGVGIGLLNRHGDVAVVTSAPSISLAPAATSSRAIGSPIAGRIANGQRFTVSDSLADGLCVTLGAVDLGCDTGGPVIAPGSPAWTPRVAVNFFEGNDEHRWLWYGYLHPSSVSAHLILPNGRRAATEAIVNDNKTVWAIPLPLGFSVDDRSLALVYVDQNGATVARCQEQTRCSP